MKDEIVEFPDAGEKLAAGVFMADIDAEKKLPGDANEGKGSSSSR